jgi:hypothetical protein
MASIDSLDGDFLSPLCHCADMYGIAQKRIFRRSCGAGYVWLLSFSCTHEVDGVFIHPFLLLFLPTRPPIPVLPGTLGAHISTDQTYRVHRAEDGVPDLVRETVV